MITGPNGPFTNIPPAIETHVEFISDAIAKAETDNAPIVEVTEEAEQKWTQLCDDMSKDSLFRRTDSWIFGANVEGKKVSDRRSAPWVDGMNADVMVCRTRSCSTLAG